MKESIVRTKSLAFAVRIVEFYKSMCEDKKEYVLSKQILRSGTSIGANVSESRNAQSDADFISKLTIALKEADETLYWLELLFKTDYINEELYKSMSEDCDELVRMLVAIIKTTKARVRS